MIKIGTCGYGYYDPPEGWKEEYKSKLQVYSEAFSAGEINKTFYRLPMVETAEKWRRNAYDEFDFTMKAWQVLTHPTSSPTWRNKKDDLSEEQKENFGYLRPNDEVYEAWKKTKDVAEAMQAQICIIQTPGSFERSKENKKNMKELLSTIARGSLELAWEPRGDWKDSKDVKEICDQLNLIHITDLLRREPVSSHEIAYVRLHGLNETEYNYNYDYSREELSRLAKRLEDLDKNHETVYCMFNNYSMFENSNELMEIM